MELPPINMVDADKLPDYRPAFTAGSAAAISMAISGYARPVPSATPAIYFIINTKGEVIDRVQLPEGNDRRLREERRCLHELRDAEGARGWASEGPLEGRNRGQAKGGGATFLRSYSESCPSEGSWL
jgi:hypothetical protein